MPTTAQDILLKILEIIGYSDDKKVFVAEFFQNVYLQSVSNLIAALPDAQGSEVEKKLEGVTDEDTMRKVMGAYFSAAQSETALQAAAGQAMTDYVAALADSLSDEQSEKILALLPKE